MCNSVFINHGEIALKTMREVATYFCFPKTEIDYNAPEMDYCLCWWDLPNIFREKNIPFEEDLGDIYVDS